MADSVQLEIMGQKFNLRGTHDKDYIMRVEKHLNEKINEVKESGGSITTFNLMVLVALNLVDDYFKKEGEIKKIVKTIENDSEKLINLIDARL